MTPLNNITQSKALLADIPTMKHFIDNLELYLTGVCVLISFVVPALFGYRDYWRVLAVTVLAITVVHGILFWIVRRRQRQVRHELIEAIRPMLADRIKNHLTVVLFAATEQRDGVDVSHVEAAIAAAGEITATLDQLSLDSLRRWNRHYRMETALN